MKYEALFEDENNIFGGTPKSKFMDVVFTANNDVVQFELETFIEKVAVMELMLEKFVDSDIDAAIRQFQFENSMECESKAKSLFIELTGSIVSKSE
ncbi:DUF2018 family protein [Sulfurimonas sp.]|uniref:DUF2018 family protein n=1 Tax=Sulfurimonas sp. TaxID=2022749 RepID=UPI003D0EBAC9